MDAERKIGEERDSTEDATPNRRLKQVARPNPGVFVDLFHNFGEEYKVLVSNDKQ